MTTPEQKTEQFLEKTPEERLDAFIVDNNLKLKTKFIPFSFSRNSEKIDIENEKSKLYKSNGLSMNWKVVISNDKNANITVDFSKGIGLLGYSWLNGYTNLKTVDEVEKANHFIYEAVENGKAYNVDKKSSFDKVSNMYIVMSKPFPTPTMKEMLESLVRDADVLEHQTFESWARDLGYDTDSRKAEKIYNTCKQESANFLKVLGSSQKLDELKNIFCDLDNEPTIKKNKP